MTKLLLAVQLVQLAKMPPPAAATRLGSKHLRSWLNYRFQLFRLLPAALLGRRQWAATQQRSQQSRALCRLRPQRA